MRNKPGFPPKPVVVWRYSPLDPITSSADLAPDDGIATTNCVREEHFPPEAWKKALRALSSRAAQPDLDAPRRNIVME